MASKSYTLLEYLVTIETELKKLKKIVAESVGADYSELIAQINGIGQELNSFKTSITDTVNTNNSNLTSKFNSLEQQFNTFKTSITNTVNSNKTEITSQVNTLNTQFSQFKTNIESQVSGLTTRMTNVENRVTSLENSGGSIGGSVDLTEVNNRISTNENNITTLQTDVSSLKGRVTSLENNGGSSGGSNGKRLIASYTHSSNAVYQPTALDVDTGIFTCSNHGLKEGQTVIPIPNGVSTVLNIHKELFTEFNKPLMVTSVTKDTFILKTKDSNIVSYSITDNSVADVEKYHFEQVNPVKVELNDIVSNNIKIIIHGVCGIGDMYFGITKDGVFHKSYNVIGLGHYEGAIALSSNATHAPFRPFRSEIEIKRTLLGFGFMFENQQYAIINRTITDRSISRKYGVIQYPYDTFNGIMLGSPVHTWIIANGTTIEVYNMEE